MPSDVPRFRRRFFDPGAPVTAIGGGSPGGKARGLLLARDLLAARFDQRAFPQVHVAVPAMTVLQTEAFDRFMTLNDLWPIARSDAGARRIALAFQAAELPPEYVGDLRSLVDEVQTPLAIRSSSLLEDAQHHPFAGVYITKMIPNDRLDADTRFRKLTEAIKLVYASTFFSAARAYIEAAGRPADDEKMAVIIQEIVGRRHGIRYYPDVAGVARSFSFYRSGNARPEEGFAALALGLGKTIVDGGIAWTYSPAHPRATPPFSTPAAALNATQTTFWAVSMDGKPRYDPAAEVEYMVLGDLADAEADGTLRFAASTYDAAADRLSVGLRGSGPRAITFAPLLVTAEYPLNAVIRALLTLGAEALDAPVEIEFAVTLEPAANPPCRLGFLQIRPMAVSSQPVEVPDTDLNSPRRLLVSSAALGNGVREDVQDIVFVRPETFEAAQTRGIAREIAILNRALVDAATPYVLIGFGRWGSSDPWLGIPVDWSSIAGAKAIVEAGVETMHVEPSQGSHFFHNVASFGVLYFTARPDVEPPIDWGWLEAQPTAAETEHVRHVRLARPLTIKVDGRTGRGVILRAEAA